MSKSYDNTIPLFSGGKKALREAVMRIVTDSRLPGEPKDPDDSSLFMLYRAFAGAGEAAAFRSALESGLSWGEAKQALFELLDGQIAPMRERYDALIAQPAHIEEILREGARKARAIATPKLARLRDAVGLGSHVPEAGASGQARPRADKPPRLASFRDEEGRFRFRLFAGDGEELLLSRAFDDPKAAGVAQKRLKQLGAAAAVVQLKPTCLWLELDGGPVGSTPDYADEQARDQALGRLRDALDQLARSA
jgi:tryptophanyl-tRNA synthetase